MAAKTDFVVLGAGIAGLRAAVELAKHGSVLVVSKEAVAESNTAYAQGGIAVAMGGDADVALHLEDTLAAGAGLVNEAAARVLVEEGPVRVGELIAWGAEFDREGGELARTREGAHSLPRILHANGDATGAEISRALHGLARGNARIRFAEWTMVADFETLNGRVVGVTLLGADGFCRFGASWKRPVRSMCWPRWWRSRVRATASRERAWCWPRTAAARGR